MNPTNSAIIVELIPDPENGGFTARIPDIPAYGERETEIDAIADLKEAFRGYIEAFGLEARRANERALGVTAARLGSFASNRWVDSRGSAALRWSDSWSSTNSHSFAFGEALTIFGWGRGTRPCRSTGTGRSRSGRFAAESTTPATSRTDSDSRHFLGRSRLLSNLPTIG